MGTHTHTMARPYLSKPLKPSFRAAPPQALFPDLGATSFPPHPQCPLDSPHPPQAGKSLSETFHFPFLSGDASESLSVWTIDRLEGRP